MAHLELEFGRVKTNYTKINMLLQPKQFKHRKLKRYIKNQLIETKSCRLTYGQIGLKALSSARISARQIESVRQCINRNLSLKVKFPN